MGENKQGMGDWLVELHGWFREELASLRRQVEEAGPVGRVPSCAEFCGGLERHHTGEDRAIFPGLAREFPELMPALDKLSEEHLVVARINAELRRLIAGYEPGRDETGPLLSEMDRLAAELDAHFRHEEEVVVAPLNATMTAPSYP